MQVGVWSSTNAIACVVECDYVQNGHLVVWFSTLPEKKLQAPLQNRHTAINKFFGVEKTLAGVH